MKFSRHKNISTEWTEIEVQVLVSFGEDSKYYFITYYLKENKINIFTSYFLTKQKDLRFFPVIRRAYLYRQKPDNLLDFRVLKKNYAGVFEKLRNTFYSVVISFIGLSNIIYS